MKNKKILSPLLHKRKDLIYAICFLVFMAMFYYIHYSGVESWGYLAKVMALFTIPLMMIFFKDRSFGNGKVQSSLSYVGSHTLEIYVLQYFFLPMKYQLANSVMGGVNCLAISLIESVWVIILCVVVIKVIDHNKYLNLIFFGK